MAHGRKLAALAVFVLAAPFHTLIAQAAASAPRLEFGFDLGLLWQKTDNGGSYLIASMPLDGVRVGFVSTGSTMFEFKGSLSFVNGNDQTSYDLGLEPRVLFRLGPGTGLHSQMGPYVFLGAPLSLVGENGGVIPNVEGGIGMRQQWGRSSAMRFEAFVRYRFESDFDCCFFPHALQVGGRIGPSFWH
jgi:hypothetical protein